jgi:hypothetical protein
MLSAFATAGQVRLVQGQWAGMAAAVCEELGAAAREMLDLDEENLDARVVLDGQSGACALRELCLRAPWCCSVRLGRP